MSDDDIFTPVDCEREIHRLNRLLEANCAELVWLRDTFAHADHAYRKARAIGQINATGKSSADREAEAVLYSEEEYHEMMVAKAAMDAARETGHSIRAQLDSLR